MPIPVGHHEQGDGMSRSEWETGEVLLPSAAVKQVRDKVWGVHNKIHDRAMELCQEFWREHSTRSVKTYEAEVKTFRERSNQISTQASRSWQGATDESVHEMAARQLAEELLERVSRSAPDGSWLGQGKVRPRRVTVRDLEQMEPKATTRTKSVCPGECSISFEGRTLHWHVSENNHAVERAYEHPVAQALMAALDKVQWTRGTGGSFWGSDEYADDAARHNPGMNPVSTGATFGPVGLEREAASMGMTAAELKKLRAKPAMPAPAPYRRPYNPGGW